MVNLVPMLDALITMIAFLLYTMTMLALVTIESPAPVSSTAENEKQLKTRPLQLTLTLSTDYAELWSPFELIQPKKLAYTPDGQPDVNLIHQAIVEVKQKFQTETKLVLVPHNGITYDTIVAVMDAVRKAEPTDPSLFRKNPQTGTDEPVTDLFPEIIFGNLLGDT